MGLHVVYYDFVVELWGTSVRHAEAPSMRGFHPEANVHHTKVPSDVLKGSHRHPHYSVNALSK